MLKKLIVVEITVEKKAVNSYEPGHKYSVFQDPETGKYYRPVDGFTVIAKEGSDLSDRFVETDDSK